MNTGIDDLLTIGTPAVVAGLTLVIALVQRELGPFAGLSPAGKWLLTGAFGAGVLAFSLKLAVALAVAKAADRIIAPMIGPPSAPARPTSSSLATAVTVATDPPKHRWLALPVLAPAPPGNPTTAEKVALGRRLFHERRLSADATLSCASCHDLEAKAGGDGRRTARGVRGQIGTRNTPTVWNAAFQSVLFWDGRVRSLEEQVAGPILNPIEMGMPSATEAARRLAADPSYRTAFRDAFGDEKISLDRIAKAIAAFERTLVAADTPYDRFVRGDSGALNPAQLRGMAAFESLGCVSCHSGPAFSDASLLGQGAAMRLFPANSSRFDRRYDLGADGGAAVAGNAARMWRVPGLRNVALTGPWLHNGAVDDLAEVVRIMVTAQLGLALEDAPAPSGHWLGVDHRLHDSGRRTVNAREIDDLVSFLNALSEPSLAGEPRRDRRTR